jgi:GNAT superfamily N-acetyltransferase
MNYVTTSSFAAAAEHFAALQYAEWGHLYPGASLEQDRDRLLNNHWDGSDLGSLNLGWFALNDDGEPLGVAMLVGEGELEPDDAGQLEGPWFAGLVVDPRFRRQGIGAALLDYVTEQARSLGFQRLRLVTEHHTAFYEQRGWTVEQDVTLNSVPNTVMFITLNP